MIKYISSSVKKFPDFRDSFLATKQTVKRELVILGELLTLKQCSYFPVYANLVLQFPTSLTFHGSVYSESTRTELSPE